MGIGFLSRPSYPCSKFLHCTQPTCTAPTFVMHLSTKFYITSPYSQFASLLTKRHYRYTMQSQACSRWASRLLTAAPSSSRRSQSTLGSGVVQSLGAACSTFTTTANTAPILPTSVGASSVGEHHLRLSSLGKTTRRLNDAREASVHPMYVSVSVSLLAFLTFLLFLCDVVCILDFRPYS